MLMVITEDPSRDERPQLISEEKVYEIAETETLKAVNRMLVAACYDALQLRGIWTAINDPLGLEMERNDQRTRFKRIELSIRAAIEKANEMMNEQ